MNGINRLLTLQEECAFAGVQMQIEARRFMRIENRHNDGTAPRAITGFNLFQTPRPIAARMAEIIWGNVGEGARILEPSAGLGRLVEPLENLRAQWLMVEEQQECFKALSEIYKGTIKQGDFLKVNASDIGGPVDAVIMNPPFKMGRDIKHIHHALDMIKPGGVLVSLCYNGSRQNEKLRPMCNTWEKLPEKSFREEGTNASVCLLTINK